MAPVPVSDKTRDLRQVPGNENISIGANQDTTCFSIYDDGSTYSDDRAAVSIHVCNYPEFIATLVQFMQDRADDALEHNNVFDGYCPACRGACRVYGSA